jgi:hypothetical protein
MNHTNKGTGYDVLLWIERAVFIDGFVPPTIAVHSANSSARIKMECAIAQINLKLIFHLRCFVRLTMPLVSTFILKSF